MLTQAAKRQLSLPFTRSKWRSQRHGEPLLRIHETITDSSLGLPLSVSVSDSEALFQLLTGKGGLDWDK